MTHPLTNPIGFLQEFCQKYGTGFPKYSEVMSTGPDHSRSFSYKCVFDGREVIGTSRQKKQAKSEAAKLMVELLSKQNYFRTFNLDVPDGAANGSICSPNETVACKNSISALYEYCQKEQLKPPEFFESSTGLGFVCKCALSGKKTYGDGPTKKSAKTEAAAQMCIELQISFRSKLFVNNELEKDQFVNNELNDDQPYSEQNSVSPFQELHPAAYQSTCSPTNCSPNETVACKNSISALYEYCQKEQLKPPEFFESSTGIGFVCECTLSGKKTYGHGPSKKYAKTEATAQMCIQLQISFRSQESINNELKLAENKVLNKIPQELYNKSITRYSERLERSKIDEIDYTINELPFDYGKHQLEELILSSDEENEKIPSDLEISKALDSLILDDSVVEIEPTAVSLNSEMKLKPPANEDTK